MTGDRIFGTYHSTTVEVLEARVHPRTGEPQVSVRLFSHGGRYQDIWVVSDSLVDVHLLSEEDVVGHSAMADHHRSWMDSESSSPRKKVVRPKNVVSLQRIMAKAMK